MDTTSVYGGEPHMAHQFSVEIHGFLTASLDAAERALKEAQVKGETEQSTYLSGRVQELKHIRQLLSSKYDLRFHKYFDSEEAKPGAEKTSQP